MPLELHLSQSLDRAAADLAEHLGRKGDPFAPVVIALGDRAQESWLRHELATRLGIAAVWQVLPWRAALDGALRARLAADSVEPARWWIAPWHEADPWQADRLRGRVIQAFRALAGEPQCQDLQGYLYGQDAPPEGAAWRELALAGEVAEVLTRLMRERPDAALRWAGQPDEPGTDQPPVWLRRLCQQLRLDDGDAPPAQRRRLLSGEGVELRGSSLILFGLSALPLAEQQLIEELAKGMEIHWFRVSCCPAWWGAALPAEAQSPLLHALGQAESVERQRRSALSVGAPAPSESWGWLLGLQTSALLDRAIAPGAWTEVDNTESLGFHSCYSPLRQVELLRHKLLHWFANDRDLEPRDVLVLTPDLATYAPMIQSVFARRGAAANRLRLVEAGIPTPAQGETPLEDGEERAPKAALRPPALPVAIADLGLAQTNPVAEALLGALELCEERVTAPRLMALLSLDPVRQRFGLSYDDVADLRALLVESGMRWGLDGADRALDDQPNQHQNTVEFGLERLALGSLMADEDLPQGLDGGALGPLVPLAVDGRARMARVARLAGIIRALTAARARFRDQELRSLRGWHGALLRLMDDLAETSDAATWLRVQVSEVLDEVLPPTDGEEGPLLGLRALRKLVADRFDLPTRGDRVVSGAVSVRQLALDAVTPAKIVCFLGMDDASFPRAYRPREWDPFAVRQEGEHDPRALDRLAMLQALMAARDRVFISWRGFELKRGRALPPCVPADELIRIVADATGKKRQDIVLRHARHPWGRAALSAGIFDRGLLEAARAVDRGKGASSLQDGRTDEGRELPDEDHPVTDLPLQTLARDLVNPSKLYLYGRLAVYLDEGQEAIPEREPIELDALDQWKLRHEALRFEEPGDVHEQTQALVSRLAGRGELPLQAGGELVAAAAMESVNTMRAGFEAVAGEETEAGPWTVALDCGVTVSGSALRVREDEGKLLLEWLEPSAADGAKNRMKAWVHLLAAKACDDRVVGARVVGSPKYGKASQLWLEAPSAGAKGELDDLVTLWKEGRRRPLPLFPKSSLAAADVLVGKTGEERRDEKLLARVASKVRSAWFGSDFSRGDLEDRWVAALFAGRDPANEVRDDAALGFMDLARRVWEPALEAEKKGLAEEWMPQGGGK